MKHPTLFHLVSAVFKEKDISAVLIGGFAVNFYKLARQTADIDFLITRDDFDKIFSLLEQEGYTKNDGHDVFVKLENTKGYLMDIDFMFVDKETLDKVIKDSKEIIIAKQKFKVPSLNHLIALKLHSVRHNPKLREYKDFPDIMELIRINKIDVKRREFKELCLKYGTEELYKRIIERNQ
ncbi:nucleotidyltransferase family protein [Patescibacteria group bacterium]|nr:nucleotidyltransferase family protein [Patescibacteria group bacterium]